MVTLEKATSQYGAQMGRRNQIDHDATLPIKLKMEALRFQDGDYDMGGAYWGYTRGTAIYCAHGEGTDGKVRIFVRAKNREEAKALVREDLPGATFWR